MNLDDFIITCFCLIDEMLPSVTQGKRLRERGPMPKLADTAGTSGLLLGDRNYWLPTLQAALRKVGVVLQAPFRKASGQPAHSWSPVLGRVRYRIDTVFGQLTDRCGAKRVWARDVWHLRNRLLRMVLMHTLCVLFNLQDEAPPLQLDRWVA